MDNKKLVEGLRWHDALTPHKGLFGKAADALEQIDYLETCARCNAKRDKVDMAHYSRGDVHLAYCHPAMSESKTCYMVATWAGFPENEEK